MDSNLIWTWFANFFGLFDGTLEIFVAAGLALAVAGFVIGLLRR